MVSVLEPGQTKEMLLESFSFFNFEEYALISGAEAIILHTEGIRFVDSGPVAKYINQESALTAWLMSVLHEEPELYLRPVYGKWLVANYPEARKDSVCKEIRRWMTNHGLRNGFSGAIGTRDRDVVANFLAATLRGYTHVEILAPTLSIIAAPCDHSDVHLFLSRHSLMGHIKDSLVPGLKLGHFRTEKTSIRLKARSIPQTEALVLSTI